MGKKSGPRKSGAGSKKGRNRHISSVKKSNIKRNKLVKTGKMKPPGSKPRFVEGGHLRERSEAKRARERAAKSMTKEQREDMLQRREEWEREKMRQEEEKYEQMADMMDPEDLDFLKRQAVKDPSNELFKQVSGKTRHMIADEIGEDYERDAIINRHKKAEYMKVDQTKELLPVRMRKGWVQRSVVVEKPEEDDDENVEADDEVVQENGFYSESDEEQELEDQTFSVIELVAKRRGFISDKKIHIGSMAANFLEVPHERMNVLEKLIKMVAMDSDTGPLSTARHTVVKLAGLTVCEILKDVIPNYKILDINQSGETKLKKETLGLQKFEQGVLKCTKSFLVKLEKIMSAKQGSYGVAKVQEMALNSMCDLLVTHPYFNFSENVVNFIVPYLNSGTKEFRAIILRSLQAILRGDKRGEISLLVIRRINHFLKSKKRDRTKPEMLEVLLTLKVHTLNEAHEQMEEDLKKKKNKKEQPLSKKERKRQKANAKLEKELLEAKGEESKKQRLKFASEIINILFAIYFRLLKALTSDDLDKVTGNAFRQLIRPLFRGLAKFGHLMSIEYFQALLRAIDFFLKEVGDRKLGKVEVFLCIQTVFAILSGQGDQLTIDPATFYRHITELIIDVDMTDSISEDGLHEILYEVLKSSFILRRKKVTKSQMIDIWKRVLLCVLQSSPEGIRILSKFIAESANTNPSGFNGFLVPDVDSEVGMSTNAGAGRNLSLASKVDDGPESRFLNQNLLNGSSLMWELSLLLDHYDPEVTKAIENIYKAGSVTIQGATKRKVPLSQPVDFTDLEGCVTELFDEDSDESYSILSKLPVVVMKSKKLKIR